jgi:AbiV family abortive infection protein
MVTNYPPIPSHDDLLAIARAAQANAEDLLGDAELLADHERYSRAYALATLAWEEVSKAYLCGWAICSTQMTPEKFWTDFRSHESKLADAHYDAEYLRPEPIGTVLEHYKKMIGGSRSTQNQKERALYVDYRRGKVLVPGQIGQRAAQAQIRSVRRVLAEAKRFDARERVAAWALLSDAINELMDSQWDDFRAAFRVAQRDGDWEALIAMVTQTPGWRKSVQLLRETTTPPIAE